MDETKSDECLFCRIRAERRDTKNLVVWRGKRCFVVLNRFPYNSGHIMISPNRHVSSLGDLRPAELADIMSAAQRCLRALDAMRAPHGYNFGANLGRAAGAGIDQHVHFHLVPRWNGDTNFMPVLADVKVVSEDIDSLCSVLARKLRRTR